MKNIIIILAVVFLVMLVACNGGSRGGGMGKENAAIFPDGEKGPDGYFTGTVWVKMLVTDENKVYDTQAYNVRFEPAARTKWHSHPGGQLLFVTSGKGYYQEQGKAARLLQKGDVVKIPINVVHWHGATPDSEFVHLGVSSRTDKGPAKWSGEVTDEEYKKAVTGDE